jgi:hypothetical protein
MLDHAQHRSGVNTGPKFAAQAHLTIQERMWIPRTVGVMFLDGQH